MQVAAIAADRHRVLAQRFEPLDASAGASNNDGCRASCVDWYGNSRPLFIRSRVLALMGYELVEGRVDGDGIVETRRVNFSPVGGFRPGPA